MKKQIATYFAGLLLLFSSACHTVEEVPPGVTGKNYVYIFVAGTFLDPRSLAFNGIPAPTQSDSEGGVYIQMGSQQPVRLQNKQISVSASVVFQITGLNGGASYTSEWSKNAIRVDVDRFGHFVFKETIDPIGPFNEIITEIKSFSFVATYSERGRSYSKTFQYSGQGFSDLGQFSQNMASYLNLLSPFGIPSFSRFTRDYETNHNRDIFTYLDFNEDFVLTAN